MKLIANKKYIYKIVMFIFIVIVLVSLKYELLWNGVSFHHIITAFVIGMYIFQKVSYYIQHPTENIWNMQTNDIEKNAIQNGDYIAIYNADKRNITIKFKNYDNGAYEITDYVPWE